VRPGVLIHSFSETAIGTVENFLTPLTFESRPTLRGDLAGDYGQLNRVREEKLYGAKGGKRHD
jgi:hypothetical protein